MVAHTNCMLEISCCGSNEHYRLISGVMMAVDTVLEDLKKMSKPVTTPEEIAQVCNTIKYT